MKRFETPGERGNSRIHYNGIEPHGMNRFAHDLLNSFDEQKEVSSMVENANEGIKVEDFGEAYDHCLAAEGKLRAAWVALMDVSENPVYCFDPSRTTEENNLETLWGVVKVVESCIDDLRALERALDALVTSRSLKAEG